MLHQHHRAQTRSLCQPWVPWGMQEALALEWDRLVESILQQEWDLKAAWDLGVVGQGSSDDVCIIFYPSPFCKPFFPPHPPTWYPPQSLLCTMDTEDTPYVTVQTHPSGPKALVLQVLPCAWGHRQWGWRWLWEEVPMSSTQGWWSCWLDPWLCEAHPDILWRYHHGFQKPQETWLPSSNSRNNLGQKKTSYLGLFQVSCPKFNLSLNLKLFDNWLPIGMTKGTTCDSLGTALSCPALLLTLSFPIFRLLFFLCLKGFYLCP